jgi:hypothetical protein
MQPYLHECCLSLAPKSGRAIELSSMELSLGQLQRAVSIRKKIAQLEAELAKLFGGKSAGSTKKRGGKRRKMSAASRRKIAAAQRARWAKAKGSKTSATKGRKKKSGLTAAGRKKISQMMKARWAARRKAKT